jgi:hypothetical protein
MKAAEGAEAARVRGWTPVGPEGVRRERWWVLGDPQAPLRRVFAALEDAGLLGEDGRLKPHVGLVSMGDHFDYRHDGEMTVADAARQGEALLTWLASHPPDQVVLLGGNHDFARVMELAGVSDAEWAEARALGTRVEQMESQSPVRAVLAAEFHSRFPEVPTPDLARRDLQSFTVSQRTLVKALLLHGRLRLAAVGVLPEGGQEVLLTHAGVSRRELGMLGLAEGATARQVAEALQGLLAQAVARVAPAWLAGGTEPLSLHPVNVTGRTRQEGGGLLHHRPALRRAEKDAEWCFRPESPRRYEPHALPRGLVQAAGHVSHGRNVKGLGHFVEEGARAVERASVRTLSVTGQDAGSYRVGIHPPEKGAATLYLVDPAFSEFEETAFEWLTLGGVT